MPSRFNPGCKCCGGAPGGTPLAWCCNLSTADTLRFTYVGNDFLGRVPGDHVDLVYGTYTWTNTDPRCTGSTGTMGYTVSGFFETPAYGGFLQYGLDFTGTACRFNQSLQTEYGVPGDRYPCWGIGSAYTVTVVSCDPLVIDVYRFGNKLGTITRL